MRIATFNIFHAENYPNFLDTGKHFIDFDAVAKVISDNGAEICSLNEVRRQNMLEGGFNYL